MTPSSTLNEIGENADSAHMCSYDHLQPTFVEGGGGNWCPVADIASRGLGRAVAVKLSGCGEAVVPLPGAFLFVSIPLTTR